ELRGFELIADFEGKIYPYYIGKNKKTQKEVNEVFGEYAFLCAVSNAYNYQEIIDVFSDYGDFVTFNLGTYSASNKSLTAKALLGHDFATMDELESAIDAAYKNQQKQSTGGGSGSGGSSGGGSSFGGVSVNYDVNSGEANQEPGLYKDIDESHWAYDTVKYLTEKKVINGDETGNFRPEDEVTRAEFAKMIVAAFGLYDTEAEAEFSDIPDTHWAYKYVASLDEKGVIMKLVRDMDVDILYSCDGWENTYQHSVSVKGGVWVGEKVSISHLPKGVYNDFKLRVESGGETLYETTLMLTLIDFYKKHPMDKYTTLGMNSYYGTAATSQDKYDQEMALAEMLGVRKMRPGWCYSWETVEESRKGEYTWSKTDNTFAIKMKENGISWYMEMAGNNPLYGSSKVPITPEEVEGFCKYIQAMMKKHEGTIHAVEIWNEPNLGQFWNVDDTYGEAYTTMVKAVYYAVKEIDPDMPVVAGVVSDSGGPKLSLYYERNMAWYMDAVAFHPYIGTGDPDGGFENVMKGFINRSADWGDWLGVYVSEMGWSSVKGTSVTEERQGEYHLKGQIESDALDNDEFICYELCDESLEDNGLGKGGLSKWRAIGIKDGFSIASNTFNQLNTARFMGRFKPRENCVVNVYLREGKPLVVAWCTKLDETAEYTFEGDNISVEDYNGNPVEVNGNTVTLIKQPYFITGISNSIVDKAIREEVKTKADEFITSYGELVSTDKMESLKNHAVNTQVFNENNINNLVNECYGYGDELIAGYSESSGYSVEKLALMLDDLRDIGKRLALLYGKFEKTGTPVSEKQIASLRELSLKKRNNDPYVGQPLTTKMIFQANQYARRADDEANISGYKGMARVDAVISQKIYGWAQKFMEIEPVKEEMGLIAYTDIRTIQVYQEAEKEVHITIDNRLSRDVTGYITVLDSEGNTVGERIEDVALKSGEKTKITVPFSVGKNAKIGKSCYHIQFIENDKVMTDQAITTEVLSSATVKLMPATVTFDQLKEVNVSLENTADLTLDTVVNLKAPEGWSLEQESIDVLIEPGETKVVSFAVKEKTPKAFHEYSFVLSAYTKDGRELAGELAALDFAVIVKADKPIDLESFDGDITDWANAYPVHAGTPQEGSSAADWQNANNALRILTKWDERYLYFLCDGYDGHHIQMFDGANMWQGDCVQIAVDPLLNGIAADGSIIDHYQSDDTEFLFAKLGSGEDQAYMGRAAEGIETGIRENYVKVIRNNEENITRYLIRIPVEDVQLKLSVNERFGWNAVMNDADTIMRERFVQITRGVGDYKAPGHYYTFTCLPSEKANVPASSSKDYVLKFSE
ncbi:MAG: S-layer homology domain-containing protein, partial [Monoglobaceae bacterium]